MVDIVEDADVAQFAQLRVHITAAEGDVDLGADLLDSPGNGQRPKKTARKRNRQGYHFRRMSLYLVIRQFFQPGGKQGRGYFQRLPQLVESGKAGGELFGIAGKPKGGIGQLGGFGKVIEIETGQMPRAVRFVEAAKVPSKLLILFVGLEQVRAFGKPAALRNRLGCHRIAILQKSDHLIDGFEIILFCRQEPLRLFAGFQRPAERRHPLLRK